MDRYKFRALRDDISDFTFKYGSLVYDEHGNPRILTDVKNMLFTTCVKETEGQYIGFPDCENTDIYEGDIMEIEYPRYMGYVGPDRKRISELKDKGLFLVVRDDTNTVDGGFGAFYFEGKKIHIDYARYGRVIGNIYQNPKLLNKE